MVYYFHQMLTLSFYFYNYKTIYHNYIYIKQPFKLSAISLYSINEKLMLNNLISIIYYNNF